MTSALIICVALLLDRLIGELSRWHPLVGFGKIAQFIEKRFNRGGSRNRLNGISAVLLVVVPPTLACAALSFLLASYDPRYASVLSILVLYFAIGGHSLVQHAQAVCTALQENDIDESRKRVSYLVSRETKEMNPDDVSRACVESVLENGSDAIFGALFWFLIAGAPGVLAYRLLNTLDAMWGYKNNRYLKFGWAAARIDDLINLIPARLTALSYALSGAFINALHCWWHQARAWDSPNAGPVMAAGAGALKVQLGGTATYDGSIHHRPQLGKGPRPQAHDIQRAIRLVLISVLLWVSVVIVGAYYCA